MENKKPVCLIILDGWGYREDKKDNAIAEAHTPFFDSLMANYPHTLLNASQENVGLPKGQIGNSEIGHMTMGSGRIIDVDLVRINKAAERDEFKTNPAFMEIFAHVKKYDSTLHVMGLVGEGGVHSHQDHLIAFLKAAKNAGVTKLAIHAITDGRDLPPQSAARYIKELENVLADLHIGFIASMHGRFYAMDRDKNWERIVKTEAAIFEGKGKTIQAKSPSEVLEELYAEGKMDEHLEPIVFLDETGSAWPISKNDGVFFFNFRSDRARQISEKILERKEPLNLCFVTLTEYDKKFTHPVAFPQTKIDESLAEVISKAGFAQAHIAETEKYAHVTYFFNGGHQQPYPNEQFFLLDSRHDIPTHDLAPEMRAKEIADKAVERINAGDDFLVINFANADMVGHTANREAIITAVETIDRELEKVIEAVLNHYGVAIVTADHGNAEVNIDQESGERHTAHTLSMVPCIFISIPPVALSTLTPGTLADIAPTIVKILGLKQPHQMTGKSLI